MWCYDTVELHNESRRDKNVEQEAREIGNVTNYEALQYLKRATAGRVPAKDGVVTVPIRCGEVEIWFGRKHARMQWCEREKLVLNTFRGDICQAAARLAEPEPRI